MQADARVAPVCPPRQKRELHHAQKLVPIPASISSHGTKPPLNCRVILPLLWVNPGFKLLRVESSEIRHWVAPLSFA